MPRLSDIDPSEVGLVVRGANRRRFSVLKSDESVELEPSFAAVLAEKADGEEQLLKTLADGDANAGRAAVAAYRLLKANAGELPEQLQKALDAMATDCAEDPGAEEPIANRADLEKAIDDAGRGKSPHADIRAHITKRAEDLGATDLLPDSWNIAKEAPEMTDTATVPVKKEDGTWDLSGVPEEQHEFMKSLLEKADRAEAAEAEKAELEKAAEAAKTGEAEALEIAKEEREIRLTREFVAKAETLGQGEEFGPVLKTVAAAVDNETFEKLEAVLKANHERAEAAGLYAQIGKSGHGNGGSDAESQLAEKAAEIRKADSSLTKEQAVTKAYNENPELYAQLRNEEG